MTDTQSWTLILGFLTATFALLGIVTTSFHRVLRAEVGSVRTGLGAEIGSLRAEMRTEFQRIDARIDHLDRDVQALTRHIFDRPE